MASISLKRGEYYYFEAFHVNSEGMGHFTIGVKVTGDDKDQTAAIPIIFELEIVP